MARICFARLGNEEKYITKALWYEIPSTPRTAAGGVKVEHG